MIAIIDYGAGNLRSVHNAFRHLQADVTIVNKPKDLADAEKVVLPGVGAFGAGMNALRKRGFVSPIKDVAQSGIPLLGICLGLQYLFESSDEMGQHEGFGLLPGHVTRFPAIDDLKVPHMGWNKLNIQQKNPLIKDVADGSYAYFVHSYYVKAQDDSDIVATTEYGIRFTSIAAHDNIYGIQCHPEKSQKVGLQILRNFLEI